MLRSFVFMLCLFVQGLALAQAQKTRGFYGPRTLVPDVPYSRNVDRNNAWQNHGVAFDSFFGITAYSNKRDGKYQCTEVVHRFLKGVYGVPTQVGNGMGHAKDLMQRMKSRFGETTFLYAAKSGKVPVRMNLRANGSSNEPPAPASVINFKIGKNGHTAVVRYVQFIDYNKVRVYLFEQHGLPALKPGQKSPIHFVDFTRNKGVWRGASVKGTGTLLYWINFEVQRSSNQP